MRLFLVTLVVLAALIVTGAIIAGPQLRSGLSSLRPDEPRTEIRSATAEVRPIVESIEAPGSIEPHTSVQISAEVSARIVELPIDEGDEVRRDQVICRLDDQDVSASLTSAKARRDAEAFRLQSEHARLAGQEASLEYAKRELGRMQTLHETGDVPMRDLDNAAERVEDLEIAIEVARHSISVMESSLAAAVADIERAEDALANTVITSPMDGLVTMLNVEAGEIVTGSTTNPGTVLMTIADLSRMVHNAEVAESDVARVEVGQRSKLYINAYPDEVFSGTVRHIAWQQSMNMNGTGFFRTEIEIDLQGRRIRSGLIANASIEVESHDGLAVPYQAILVRDVESLPDALRDDPLVDVERTKATVVFRVVDGKAVCTPVRGGASDATHRLVEAGLSAGDVVITGPFKELDKLDDGELVKDMDEDTDEDTGEDAGEDTDGGAEGGDEGA